MTRQCSVEGCKTPAHGTIDYKKYCQKHYRRIKRNGDPNTVLPRGRKSQTKTNEDV